MIVNLVDVIVSPSQQTLGFLSVYFVCLTSSVCCDTVAEKVVKSGRDGLD